MVDIKMRIRMAKAAEAEREREQALKSKTDPSVTFDSEMQSFSDVGPQETGIAPKAPFARPEVYPEEAGFRKWLMAKNPLESAAGDTVKAIAGAGVPGAKVSDRVAKALGDALTSVGTGGLSNLYNTVSEGTGADMLQGFGRGASYGFQDELEGLLATMDQPNPLSDEAQAQYVGARDAARHRQDLAAQNRPYANLAGMVAGAISAPGPKGASAPAGASKLQAAKMLGASGAKSGAMQGAVQGLGEGEGDLLDQILSTATGSALGGAGGGVVGAGMGALGQALRGKAASAAYKALGKTGPELESMGDDAGRTVSALADEWAGPTVVGETRPAGSSKVVDDARAPLSDEAKEAIELARDQKNQALLRQVAEGLIDRGTITNRATKSAEAIRPQQSYVAEDLGGTFDDWARMVGRESNKRKSNMALDEASRLKQTSSNKDALAQAQWDSLLGDSWAVENLKERIGKSLDPIEIAELNKQRQAILTGIGDSIKHTQSLEKEAKQIAAGSKQIMETPVDQLPNKGLKFNPKTGLVSPALSTDVPEAITPLDDLIQTLTSRSKETDKAARLKTILGNSVLSGTAGATTYGAANWQDAGEDPVGFIMRALTTGAVTGGLGGLAGLKNTPAIQSKVARGALMGGRLAQHVGSVSGLPVAEQGTPAMNALYERLSNRPQTPEQMKEEENRQNANSQQHFIKGNGG